MKLNKTDTVKITTDHDLCIGCGLCFTSCKDDAIVIKFDKNKEYKPTVNFDNCTNCVLCYHNCPMSVINLTERISTAEIQGVNYGLENAVNFYKGYENNYESYIKSSSGGILSSIIKYLLKTGEIDAVVHAEQLFSDNTDKFYKASISKSVEEIERKRSSFYYPIEFSGVLEEVIADESIKNIAFLGTPCVISGLHYLTRTRKDLKNKVKYKFSLICSHNTSAQFTEVLSKSLNKSNKLITFKHREKQGIPNADNFDNSIEYEDGKKVSKSRYKTPFTTNWRTYSYAMNGCSYCPDFFGVHADAGFKDAWGFSTERKEGETVLFVNDNHLSEVLAKMQEENLITLNSITKKEVANSQKITLASKTVFIGYRRNKHKALRKGIRIKRKYSPLERVFLFFNSLTINFSKKTSKFLYRNFKKAVPDIFLKFPAFVVKKTAVYLALLSKAYEKDNKFEVLYTAGFGYENIGDEAQLSTNLQVWKEYDKNVKVTILSPNPDYTRETHGSYDILYASRNTFWGVRNIDYSGIGESKYFKTFFRLKLFLLSWNARFMKYFNRTLCISTEASYLLKRMKQANLLHIGGGGYLTGKTSSRLYDYMGLIKIAHILNTEIILSGHNIGIWQNNFQKRIAKQLNKAKFIGLRDNDKSVSDLKEINVFKEEKVISLFDDALFCEDSGREKLNEYFTKNNLDFNKKYILLNAYYFKNTEKQVKETLTEIASIVDNNLSDKEISVILLSMHDTDFPALKYLSNILKTENVIFKHDDDFKLVISLIRNAYSVISFRHHPIIFAMSAGVPTISVVFDDYFRHKNIGAMKLFEQEDNVCTKEEVFTGKFTEKVKASLNKREEISEIILNNTNTYRSKKGHIIHKYIKEYTYIKKNDSKK